MSESYNGNWHNVNGAGLPFRPPTVDEALPYSPFTSIVPFSPDIIPFPSAEPSTPPTTLSFQQQSTAKKAVDTLDEEIRSKSTSQHLQQTLQHLQDLLNPDTLSEFHFKPIAQLATPPPDSPTSAQTNGNGSAKISLSPFASMLLKTTNVPFVPPGQHPPARSQQNRGPARPAAPQSGPRTGSHLPPKTSFAQNSSLQYTPHGTPSGNTASAPAPPGSPSIIVKPLHPGSRRDDYQRVDVLKNEETLSQKKRQTEKETPIVKSREREVADRKVEELYSVIDEVLEEKDIDQSGFFRTLDTDDGEILVPTNSTLSHLSDAVSKVANLGCFPNVPTARILSIQSLCEPLITATSQQSLHIDGSDDDEFVTRLNSAQAGLRACKLILQTMTEGRDDRRICSEDLVQSLIRLGKQVLNSCITPVVESRRSGLSSELFAIASQRKNDIYPVLRLCGSIFTQVAALIGKIRLSGFTLSPIESMCIDVIFAENGAKESESVLGIQKFESFRQKAMDLLAQTFACHPDQRDSIAGEVLNNLERLPDKRANARQFKSAREAPIMLVSALFMRIVQAAGSNNSEKVEISEQVGAADSDGEDDHDDSDSEADELRPKARNPANRLGQTPNQIVTRLWGGASMTAGHIATTLVNRAENVSKSGDKPFRNLLDLFIEDLCNVLGSPEWPAASLFLEKLLAIMVNYAQNQKERGVQAADMALAAIGSMGVGIIDFLTRLKQHKRSLDISQSEIASRLAALAEDALKGEVNKTDLLDLNGPFRVLLESLPGYLSPQGAHASRDEPHTRSLSGYLVTSWVNTFYGAFKEKDDEPRSQAVIDIEKYLQKVIMDPNWFSKEYNFQDVTDTECQLAAGIIASQEPFCRYLQILVNCLLGHTLSQSAKIKSRAMTSLTQLIEKDPQVIDEKTFPRLTRLILDTSPLVRENTLSLISKCLERDPSLERHCFQGVLNLMTDPANGPKKKAIKLLKDIYVSMKEKDRKVRIATEVLLPVLDEDKAVAELARQTLEDIWIARLRFASRTDENQMKLKREKQISLLVDTVHSIQTRPAHQEAFESFFNTLLSPAAKNVGENIGICKQMIEDMVTSACTDSSVGHNSQLRILQTLSIFAKVSPRLFTVGQVELLKTYVKDLKTAEEVAIFRPTVVIFRHVFPVLSSLQETFLEEIRAPLTFTVARLAQQVQNFPQYKETLLDVVHCLWIISPLVKGDPQRLNSGMEKTVTLLCSVAAQLELITTSGKAAAEQKKVLSYLVMLGVFGKVFDLDEHIDIFKRRISMQTQSMITAKKATADQLKRLTAWKNPSAAVLLLDLILPFTKQAWDINLRQQALCSIGEVCQQKTKHFTRKDIETAFKLPFINQDDKLIRVVLTQFRDFLASAERRSETGAVIKVGEGAVHGAERMQVSYAATDNDHATTHIARTFLPDLVKTALGEANDLAVFATEILVSISRQGLLHPKECGTALVALSTSMNPQISAKASAEHHKTHLQHETMFEKEYVSAVTLAFQYHRDVFGDPQGATPAQTSFKPKMQLLFDAFKQGSRKTLKKFTTNIFRQLNFELPKLDVSGETPEALLFARFCLENFAFFDLQRVDEVSHLILTIESIVLKQTGPSVALAIETEMPEQSFEQPPQIPITENINSDIPLELQPQVSVDLAVGGALSKVPGQESMSEERLRHLTIASMILHMMWETRIFLRRAYNLNNKISPKDLQKPATRIGFVTGKDFWERIGSIMSSLSSSAAMRAECREFAEIINIDGEHAVGDDEDGDAAEKLMAAAAGYETPEEDEEGRGATPTSGRNRKRKSNAGLVGHTPKKPRVRAPSVKNKSKRNSKTPEDSD